MGIIVRWGHQTTIVDVEWCWLPFIPFGKVTIIEGDGGDGKTTLILTIAAMLSRGKTPPSLIRGHLVDEQDCSPITTFYLTNEDEVADSTLKRFVRAGGAISRFSFSGELEHHMTLNEDELMEAIEKTGCRLLIIDPFQAFLPEGTNMGSITKMRSIFTMLGNVAKTTGVAIVLVGHLNKNENSKDIHRGFGSADIAASVRSILMVGMDKNDRENRWVRTIKSNFDESDYTPVRLVLDDERRLHFADFDTEDDKKPADNGTTVSASPPKKIELAMEILHDLLAGGQAPVSVINDRMADAGIGSKTAQRAKTRLGAIQDYDGGTAVWKLPKE